MTRAREEVARELRAGDGLLVLRERPELARTAQRWAATGGLGMVLPGVYADPGGSPSPTCGSGPWPAGSPTPC